jgi:hypothetical protein
MTSDIDIEQLLRQRNASLKRGGGEGGQARQREALTKVIEENYPSFEPVRDLLLARHSKNTDPMSMIDDHGHGIIEELHRFQLVEHADGRPRAAHVDARRYLSGGWLEELAWLAAMEAGAHEALYGQPLSWQVGDYYGENEIDLIVRHGARLGFVSCKALQSEFDSENRKHRNRLMDALHEADNLADHFGKPGERVAVLVTTDLIDEMKQMPRYTALMGKAAVLDVRIIPLEELGWNKLVAAMSELIFD